MHRGGGRRQERACSELSGQRTFHPRGGRYPRPLSRATTTDVRVRKSTACSKRALVVAILVSFALTNAMRRVLQVAVRSLSHAPSPSLRLSDSVSAALRQGAPVVALESTIISHGMVRCRAHRLCNNSHCTLAIPTERQDSARSGGCRPAAWRNTGHHRHHRRHAQGWAVGERDGAARYRHIGTRPLTALLCSLMCVQVSKVSRRDVSRVVARCGHGSTTVAATMMIAEMAGIDVFATGGLLHHASPLLSSPLLCADIVQASAACTAAQSTPGTCPLTSQSSVSPAT